METFAITLGGYVGFGVSLIIAVGATAAIRFKEVPLAANRQLYVWLFIASTAIGTTLIATTGGLKKLRLTYQHFDEYCQSAHIIVHKTVSGVREVYFSDGSQCLGNLNSDFLSSCERPAYDSKSFPDKPYEREYDVGGRRVVDRIEKPQSEYAVLIKGLSTELDRQLGIGHAEKTVQNLRTGEVLATIRWAVTDVGPLPFRTQWCPENAPAPIEGYVFGWGNEKTRKWLEHVIEQSRQKRGKQ